MLLVTHTDHALGSNTAGIVFCARLRQINVLVGARNIVEPYTAIRTKDAGHWVAAVCGSRKVFRLPFYPQVAAFYPKGHTERTARLLLAFHTMAGGDLERCVDDLVADTSVLAFTGQAIDIGFDLERAEETGERFIEGLWFFEIRQVCSTGNNGPFRAGNAIPINLHPSGRGWGVDLARDDHCRDFDVFEALVIAHPIQGFCRLGVAFDRKCGDVALQLCELLRLTRRVICREIAREEPFCRQAHLTFRTPKIFNVAPHALQAPSGI